MKIDIEKIKRSGLTEQDFKLAYNADNSLISLPETEFDGEVEVVCTAYLSEDGKVFIKGNIIYTLVGECSRCLSDVKKTFEVPFEEVYSKDDEDAAYRIQSGIIDLTKTVDDNIIMSMPMKLLCKDDCQGISY